MPFSKCTHLFQSQHLPILEIHHRTYQKCRPNTHPSTWSSVSVWSPVCEVPWPLCWCYWASALRVDWVDSQDLSSWQTSTVASRHLTLDRVWAGTHRGWILNAETIEDIRWRDLVWLWSLSIIISLIFITLVLFVIKHTFSSLGSPEILKRYLLKYRCSLFCNPLGPLDVCTAVRLYYL